MRQEIGEIAAGSFEAGGEMLLLRGVLFFRLVGKLAHFFETSALTAFGCGELSELGAQVVFTSVEHVDAAFGGAFITGQYFDGGLVLSDRGFR